MAALAIGFLASLVFTGLEPLWRTRSAAALLLVSAAALVVLINTAYREGAGAGSNSAAGRRGCVLRAGARRGIGRIRHRLAGRPIWMDGRSRRLCGLPDRGRVLRDRLCGLCRGLACRPHDMVEGSGGLQHRHSLRGDRGDPCLVHVRGRPVAAFGGKPGRAIENRRGDAGEIRFPLAEIWRRPLWPRCVVNAGQGFLAHYPPLRRRSARRQGTSRGHGFDACG